MTLKPPLFPDDVFGKRFRKGNHYGFYVRNEGNRDDSIQKDIAKDNRWVVLNLNPQQLSVREPVATAIQFTQGGGKIRESRGGITKMVSISGTTGFTPLVEGVSLHNEGKPQLRPGGRTNRRELSAGPGSDAALGQRSGFLAFHRLRYLFRLYAYELRKGNIFITMNYFDLKNNDFWRIEPQEFAMTRSSRKPFSYDYSISFQVIEDASFLARTPGGEDYFKRAELPDFITDSGVKQSLRRLGEQSFSLGDAIKRVAGTVQRAAQGVLTNLNRVTNFFETINDVTRVVSGLPQTLINQLDNSLRGFIAATDTFFGDDTNPLAVGESTWNKLKADFNEWQVETQPLVDHLRGVMNALSSRRDNIRREDEKFSTNLAKDGIKTSVFPNEVGGVGSPTVSPYFSASGLGLVTDVEALTSSTAVHAVVVSHGDTIYSLAQQYLGDINRFLDLVFLNNLQAPYIVASGFIKPANTIAWGEFIDIPGENTNSLVGPSGPAGNVPSYVGAVTDLGISTDLIDTVASTSPAFGWSVNQWVGYTVTLTHLGIEYTRVVVANTANTLTVNIPWSPAISVGDTYTMVLVLFDVHRPVAPDAKAFGTDILLRFTPAAGATSSNTLADIVIGSRKDVTVVRGLENFFQAVNIRTRVEIETHPVHRQFGIAMPVGRPMNEEVATLYSFFFRQSILEDSRVQNVQNLQVDLEGTSYAFSADIQPIQSRNSSTINVTLP